MPSRSTSQTTTSAALVVALSTLLLLAPHPTLGTDGACTFPVSLAGLQCQNMRRADATTAESCRASCCAMAAAAAAAHRPSSLQPQPQQHRCTAWNFSPGHQEKSCWLWTNSAAAPVCAKPGGTWKVWQGGMSNSTQPLPPPPPPPPSPSPSPMPPAPSPTPASSAVLDLEASGPVFGGIGAISGGGATSRLLIDYPEPQRSQLLDLMFKPLSGAALSILKVEVGGGAFTSDGAEASHAYTADDRSPHRFDRGYEFWLMREAKLRNPNIVLYGLPWSFPAWVGGGSGSPWHNLSLPASYIVDWVRGARDRHNLTIDWIGDWNESPVDWDYNLELRAALDRAGFSHTRIVASDQGNGWAIPPNNNMTELAVIDAVGAHYPGVHGGPPSQAEAKLLAGLSKPLWASEDGASTPFISATWARTVNENFVSLNISATIAWNLITSYDDALPYQGRGIMGVANTPWCAAFDPYAAVWVSAHTTWFTQPQTWHYIGGGHLSRGGSWVALTDGAGGLSIVIEKQAWEDTNHQQWHPTFFPTNYSTSPEIVEFTVTSQLSLPKSLGVWRSHLQAKSAEVDPGAYANASANISFLVREPDLVPVTFPSSDTSDGTVFRVTVDVDDIVTLSTRVAGVPDVAPLLPRSSATSCVFPRKWAEDFDSVALGQSPRFFQDMHGAFEAVSVGNISGLRSAGKVLRQMAVGQPIGFHGTDTPPLSVLGSQAVLPVSGGVRVDVAWEPDDGANASASAVIAMHITDARCGHCGAYFQLWPNGKWSIGPSVTLDPEKPRWKSGSLPRSALHGTWYTMQMNSSATDGLRGSIDDNLLFDGVKMSGVDPTAAGWIGLGTGSYKGATVLFDNFGMDLGTGSQ